jgi:hypothetical protein
MIDPSDLGPKVVPNSAISAGSCRTGMALQSQIDLTAYGLEAQHFPVPVVHGLLAVTTLTLAILAAPGVGSS